MLGGIIKLILVPHEVHSGTRVQDLGTLALRIFYGGKIHLQHIGCSKFGVNGQFFLKVKKFFKISSTTLDNRGSRWPSPDLSCLGEGRLDVMLLL